MLIREEAIFETSLQAGPTGHSQWGLDTGTHQNSWNPYSNLPAHWNHGDREGNDSELQVCASSTVLTQEMAILQFWLGPLFKDESLKMPDLPNKPKKPRPHPQPVHKKKDHK